MSDSRVSGEPTDLELTELYNAALKDAPIGTSGTLSTVLARRALFNAGREFERRTKSETEAET